MNRMHLDSEGDTLRHQFGDTLKTLEKVFDQVDYRELPDAVVCDVVGRVRKATAHATRELRDATEILQKAVGAHILDRAQSFGGDGREDKPSLKELIDGPVLQAHRDEVPPPRPGGFAAGLSAPVSSAAQEVCAVQDTYERLVQWGIQHAREIAELLANIGARGEGAPGWVLVKLEELAELAIHAPAWTSGQAGKLAAENRCLHQRIAGQQKVITQLAQGSEIQNLARQSAQRDLDAYRTSVRELIFGARLTDRAISRLRQIESRDGETSDSAQEGIGGGESERVNGTAREHLARDAAQRRN